MRLLKVAITLAVLSASTSAFAQGSYHHHKWCQVHGSSHECAYDTLAQCKASKNGPLDRCVPNSAPSNH
jgi:hypothetical protein